MNPDGEVTMTIPLGRVSDFFKDLSYTFLLEPEHRLAFMSELVPSAQLAGS